MTEFAFTDFHGVFLGFCIAASVCGGFADYLIRRDDLNDPLSSRQDLKDWKVSVPTILMRAFVGVVTGLFTFLLFIPETDNSIGAQSKLVLMALIFGLAGPAILKRHSNKLIPKDGQSEG